MVSYEWKACKALYRALRINAAESNCTVAVPAGWYTLIDEYGESTRMLIYEDQLVGLNRMMKDKSNGSIIQTSMLKTLLTAIFQASVINQIFMNLNYL